MEDSGYQGVTWVGLPLEVVRVSDPVYLDQAQQDFASYIAKTLAASQRHGGRFNPPGEFGAIYSASDEETALAEVAARYAREGIPGLLPTMGLIGILVRQGRLTDLSDEEVQLAWNANLRALTSPTPTVPETEHCWDLGRAIRAVADFLKSPSARAAGTNIPLFPDREKSELVFQPQSIRLVPVPRALVQRAQESW